MIISKTPKNLRGFKSKHLLFLTQSYKRCEVKVTGTVIMKKCSLIVSSVPLDVPLFAYAVRESNNCQGKRNIFPQQVMYNVKRENYHHL